MSKIFYYKLSKTASVFFDPKSRMKVTNGVPSKTAVQTPTIKNATKAGHIIEISEQEYTKALSLLPKATQVAVEKEQSKLIPAVKASKLKPEEAVEEPEEDEEEAETDEAEDNGEDDRPELLRQLKEVTSKKNYNLMKDKSNAEIKKFLEE